MTDDQFDRFLTEAARQYREPPPTPRDQIWARIAAARRAERRPGDTPIIEFDATHRRRRGWYLAVAALAAVLLLGIAIGRVSVRPTPAVQVAERTSDSATVRRTETIMRFAAVEHLSRVETLLTEYETGMIDAEFEANAKDLLSRTRLLLDSERLRDPRLRALLDDLELVLAQISQLTADSSAERRWIEEGITERRVRARLRDAIPAGPAA